MKRDLIYEVFSQLQEGEYVRLAWEDKDEKFHWQGIDNYKQFTAKVNELKSLPSIASIWFTPHPSNSETSHENDNVKHVQWVYVDIDDISAEDFLAEYDFITPTYTVATGHGVQLYWKLKQQIEMPNDEWKGIEKAIEKKFNGEKGYACALLRVPGTFNRKHLIEKHRDKGYTVETECKVIKFSDIAYDLDEFIRAGLKINVEPAEVTKTANTKLSLTDLARIRQNCPAINDAFASIENDKDVGKTAGHNKRLAVASMIKHTINDEDYVLGLFSKTSDFNREKTLKHYRSITKGAVTCEKLQDWRLCSKTCQLIQDLGKKSPIVFAYRANEPLNLKTKIEHFNEIKDPLNKANAIDKFLSQAVAKQDPLKQDAILKEISNGCKLSIKGLRESLKNAGANEGIDYSQPLNKILLGIVSSVEKGRVAFEWFEKNGGRFYKDKEHNCYLFYKDNIYRIDSNRPFKSLILKTANISESTIGGKVIFDAMANLAFEKGNKMESCSWQYTDVINHKVYISLNNDKNELIQISSSGIEVIKNGNNPDSIFLQGSNKILPINYTELDDTGRRDAFRKIKELIFDNLACAPADRYLYLSWVLAFPLIGYLRTIPHMRLEGSSGSGKSRGMELISYLIYGESALKCATVASNYTDGALNPLILLDNIESRNLSSALEDFIITAVTGISKEKRSIGTNKENIRESVKTLINSSGIESLNKNELINRTLIIDFDRVNYGNANYSELVYNEIIRHRDIMLSGVFQLIKHVYAGLLSGELEKVKVDISKKHPGHSKDRADNYLAIMKMIAGKLIEHFEDSLTVDCLFDSWINGQDSHAQTTSADTNPILQYLSSLMIEFSRYNHIKEDYEVRGSSGLLDCRWRFSGTASHFFATFTKLAKKMGLPMEYKSAGVLAKRFKDSRKILEAAEWTFEECQLRSRVVEYKFKYSPQESGEGGEAEKTDSPPVSPRIKLNAVGS